MNRARGWIRALIRFLTFESFDGAVIAGVRSKYPRVDIVRAVEVGLGSTPDIDILRWATQHGRVVLSRDISTMRADAINLINQGNPPTGLLLSNDRYSRGAIIDQIEVWSRKELEEAFAYPIQYMTPY